MLAALSSSISYQFTSTSGSKVPDIAEVQRRAIDYARLDPKEITTWKKRTKLAALLPKFQLDYGMAFKNDVNVNINDSVYVGSSGTTVGPEQGDVSQNINTNQNIGVRAIWSFSDAVFSPEELAVSEETRLLARERQAILSEVNRNYYERRKLAGELFFLSAQLKKTPRDDKVRQEIFAKNIALDEATAALDALTGGWFGAQISSMEGGNEK